MTENPVLKVLNRMNWTQSQLAHALNIKQAAVSVWQKEARITPAFILPVCALSGFYPDELDENAPKLEQIETARRYFEGLGR